MTRREMEEEWRSTSGCLEPLHRVRWRPDGGVIAPLRRYISAGEDAGATLFQWEYHHAKAVAAKGFPAIARTRPAPARRGRL